MRGYIDEMVAVGKPLEDDDLICCIPLGLDAEYKPMVENINGHIKPITLSDLYAQLLSRGAAQDTDQPVLGIG
uniref:Uncharacterized protein n=1 Tax=Arundo donax TaxID=35708 RepID=A0A0A9A9Q1_ARUDO